MPQPLISVVVTTYNNNQTLAGALGSIKNQAYANVEVIVVDDGSEDQQAKDIMVEFEQSQSLATDYLYQDNQGPAAARNRGIEKARGEFLCFLDADDEFAPDKLSIQSHLLQNLPQDYACVLGSVAKFTDAKPQQRQIVAPSPVDGELDREQFIFGNLRLEGTPGYLFRRAALIAVGGFDQDLRHLEDFDLLLRLSKKYKVKTHSQVAFYQRLHADSLSQQDAIAGLQGVLQFVEKIAARFPHIAPAALDRRRQRAHFTAALWCLRRRRFGEFRWLMLRGAALGGRPQTWRGLATYYFAKLLPVAQKKPAALT